MRICIIIFCFLGACVCIGYCLGTHSNGVLFLGVAFIMVAQITVFIEEFYENKQNHITETTKGS